MFDSLHQLSHKSRLVSEGKGDSCGPRVPRTSGRRFWDQFLELGQRVWKSMLMFGFERIKKFHAWLYLLDLGELEHIKL